MFDFPNVKACVVLFAGCNMRCIYCYNTQIAAGEGKVGYDEFVDFLNSRKGEIDGVVFSGGECTLSEDFLDLAKNVKKLGFLLKIDTNGSNPNAIKKAVELNLIDFISLDFKADEENFKIITNSNLYENFLQTLRFLISKNFDFEVRTTVHSDFLDEKTIEKMAKILEFEGYKGEYFLQNFLYTGENFGCIGEPKSKFDPSKISSNLKISLRNF